MDYRNDMALSEADRHQILKLAETINRRNRTERANLEKRLSHRVSAAGAEIDRLVLSFREVDPHLRHRIFSNPWTEKAWWSFVQKRDEIYRLISELGQDAGLLAGLAAKNTKSPFSD